MAIKGYPCEQCGDVACGKCMAYTGHKTLAEYWAANPDGDCKSCREMARIDFTAEYWQHWHYEGVYTIEDPAAIDELVFDLLDGDSKAVAIVPCNANQVQIFRLYWQGVADLAGAGFGTDDCTCHALSMDASKLLQWHKGSKCWTELAVTA